MSAGDLLRHASSFFWYHVDRLYSLSKDGEAIEEGDVALLLVHFFDSFHSVLDPGEGVQVRGELIGSHVLLPKLGLRLPIDDGLRTLEKGDGNRIQIRDDGEAQMFDLDDPGENVLPQVAVPPSARVLFEVDSLIGSTIASQKLAHLTPEERQEFGDMLGEALAIIGEADPVVAERVTSLIRWYFPIQTPDKLRVHNSFTISLLSGAVFLSEAYRLMSLVEAVVHEYYHNELWLAMRVEPHLKDSGEENLYSPWRNDARPLTGLYHGTYVFTGLLEFHAAACRSPALRQNHQHFDALRRKSYYQVTTALAQFPMHLMEPRGREYVEKLAVIAERHGRELGATRQDIPTDQLEHWDLWSSTYPQLVPHAVPPAAIEHPYATVQGGAP